MPTIKYAAPKSNPVAADLIEMFDSQDVANQKVKARLIDVVNGGNFPLTLTPSANVQLDCAQANSFLLTPAQAATLTAINFVKGQTITLQILTSGGTSYAMTFGSGLRAAGNLNTGTVTAKYWMVTFECIDGANLVEVSRSASAL